MFQPIPLIELANAMSLQDLKEKHNKKRVNPVEEFLRVSFFRDITNIIKHLEAAGNDIEVNAFADMTKDKFELTYFGMLQELSVPSNVKESPLRPADVDRP